MLSSLFNTLTGGAQTPKGGAKEEIPLQERFEIEVRGENIPVRILYERRYNNRVTVNKNGILIRISSREKKEEQRRQIDTFLKWAKEKLGDKPGLLDSLPQRKYTNGEVLKVGQYEFAIGISYHEASKSSSAKLFGNNIVLSIARGLTPEAEENACTYLVGKCLCKFFLPIVRDRINELNERHFKKPVKLITMKYATSFWGHCSRNGHIVISARLMFAPQRVIDYVFIHELAHLVHMDHSPRFWKVVEQVMPDYRNAEKLLKDYHLKYYL